MLDLRPVLALSLDQQRIDFDLTVDLDAVLVEELIVGEDADRYLSDLAPDARSLEGFPRGRIWRLQSLDRPAFRNDPASGPPSGDEEDFERRGWRESIGKRRILDAESRLDLPFVRLAANRASPDSTAVWAAFRRLATQGVGGKSPVAPQSGAPRAKGRNPRLGCRGGAY